MDSDLIRTETKSDRHVTVAKKVSHPCRTPHPVTGLVYSSPDSDFSVDTCDPEKPDLSTPYSLQS